MYTIFEVQDLQWLYLKAHTHKDPTRTLTKWQTPQCKFPRFPYY